MCWDKERENANNSYWSTVYSQVANSVGRALSNQTTADERDVRAVTELREAFINFRKCALVMTHKLSHRGAHLRGKALDEAVFLMQHTHDIRNGLVAHNCSTEEELKEIKACEQICQQILDGQLDQIDKVRAEKLKKFCLYLHDRRQPHPYGGNHFERFATAPTG